MSFQRLAGSTILFEWQPASFGNALFSLRFLFEWKTSA